MKRSKVKRGSITYWSIEAGKVLGTTIGIAIFVIIMSIPTTLDYSGLI